MPDKESPFSPEYEVAGRSTPGDQRAVSGELEVLGQVTQPSPDLTISGTPSREPGLSLQNEIALLGLSKPRRVIVRARIIDDQDS
jgi:hypothetical protein